uniref:Uncharacterized protein n=1 Tax=Anguilla anguilla TaxID=7936 RepID=A0A0E9RAY6_ANGAN
MFQGEELRRGIYISQSQSFSGRRTEEMELRDSIIEYLQNVYTASLYFLFFVSKCFCMLFVSL